MALSSGRLEIKNARVRCAFLNRKLPGDSVPLQCKSGRVGRVTAVIPWHALGKEPISVELFEVDLVVGPRRRAEGKENGHDDGDKENKDERAATTARRKHSVRDIKRDTWAVLIDTCASVFRSATLRVTDVAVRFETNNINTSDEESPAALLRFDEIRIGDENANVSTSSGDENSNVTTRIKVLSVRGATVEVSVLRVGNNDGREWVVVLDGNTLEPVDSRLYATERQSADAGCEKCINSSVGVYFVAAAQTRWSSGDAFVLGEAPVCTAYSAVVSTAIEITADPSSLTALVEVASAYAEASGSSSETDDEFSETSDLFAAEESTDSTEEQAALGEMLAAAQVKAARARERMNESVLVSGETEEDVFFDAEETSGSRKKKKTEISVSVDVPAVRVFLGWESVVADESGDERDGVVSALRDFKLETSKTLDGQSLTGSVGSLVIHETKREKANDTKKPKQKSSNQTLKELPESYLFDFPDSAGYHDSTVPVVVFSSRKEIRVAVYVPVTDVPGTQTEASAAVTCFGPVFCALDAATAGRVARLIGPWLQGKSTPDTDDDTGNGYEYGGTGSGDTKTESGLGRSWVVTLEAPRVRAAVTIDEPETRRGNAAAVDLFDLKLETAFVSTTLGRSFGTTVSCHDDGVTAGRPVTAFSRLDSSFAAVDAYLCLAADTAADESKKTRWSRVGRFASETGSDHRVEVGLVWSTATRDGPEGIHLSGIDPGAAKSREDSDLATRAMDFARGAGGGGETKDRDSDNDRAIIFLRDDSIAASSLDVCVTCAVGRVLAGADLFASVQRLAEALGALPEEHPMRLVTPAPEAPVTPVTVSVTTSDRLFVVFQPETGEVGGSEVTPTMSPSMFASANGSFHDANELPNAPAEVRLECASLFAALSLDGTQKCDFISLKASGGALVGKNTKTQALVVASHGTETEFETGNNTSTGQSLTPYGRLVSVMYARQKNQAGVSVGVSHASAYMDEDVEVFGAIADVTNAFKRSSEDSKPIRGDTNDSSCFFSCFDIRNSAVAVAGDGDATRGVVLIDRVLHVTETGGAIRCVSAELLLESDTGALKDPVVGIQALRVQGLSLHVAPPLSDRDCSGNLSRERIPATEKLVWLKKQKYARVAFEDRIAVDSVTTTGGKSRTGIRLSSLKCEARQDAFGASLEFIENLAGRDLFGKESKQTDDVQGANTGADSNETDTSTTRGLKNLTSYITHDAFTVGRTSSAHGSESVASRAESSDVVNEFYAAPVPNPLRARKNHRPSRLDASAVPFHAPGSAQKPPNAVSIRGGVPFETEGSKVTPKVSPTLFAAPRVVARSTKNAIDQSSMSISGLGRSRFGSLSLGKSLFVDTADALDGVRGSTSSATARWFDGTSPGRVGEASAFAHFAPAPVDATKTKTENSSLHALDDFCVPSFGGKQGDDNNTVSKSVVSVRVAQLKAVCRPGREWANSQGRRSCSSSCEDDFSCDGVRFVVRDFVARTDTFDSDENVGLNTHQETPNSRVPETTFRTSARVGDAGVFSRQGAQNSSPTTLLAHDATSDRENTASISRSGQTVSEKNALLKLEVSETRSVGSPSDVFSRDNRDDDTERTAKASVLPLRVSVDRNALEFLIGYFAAGTTKPSGGDEDDDDDAYSNRARAELKKSELNSNEKGNDASSSNAADDEKQNTKPYFRHVELRLCTLRLDHAVRDLEFGVIRKELRDRHGFGGVLREISNLVPLKGVLLDFSSCVAKVRGVAGYENVSQKILAVLLKHVTDTQTGKFVDALGPVKSAKKVTQGALAFAEGASACAAFLSQAAAPGKFSQKKTGQYFPPTAQCLCDCPYSSCEGTMTIRRDYSLGMLP